MNVVPTESLTRVRVFLAPTDVFSASRSSSAIAAFANRRWADYEPAGSFFVHGPGCEPVDFAEEMFDLTNSPFRDQERASSYGRKRSISVGDVVAVEDRYFLCNAAGWTELLITE